MGSVHTCAGELYVEAFKQERMQGGDRVWRLDRKSPSYQRSAAERNPHLHLSLIRVPRNDPRLYTPPLQVNSDGVALIMRSDRDSEGDDKVAVLRVAWT